MTSVWVMNGMMILMSSLVAGSKIIFTSFFTTSSAIFSGITKPNISTNNLTRSGLLPLGGRYIIGRESPTAANEKPGAGVFAAEPFSAAETGPATSGNTAMNANNTEQTFVGGWVCFIFYLPFSNWFFGAGQKMMLIPIRGEILLLQSWQGCILDFGPIRVWLSELQ